MPLAPMEKFPVYTGSHYLPSHQGVGIVPSPHPQHSSVLIAVRELYEKRQSSTTAAYCITTSFIQVQKK
ncbi:hypothetical protein Y1Q_0016823 [Alligator mississippiensis]|uniref:Uncharacterized protein n=1 Tax=Alligator mississippiensis TaxID=8496 RepID=A0A151P7G9_ALLMI|nr:hypothetical protein Y1Q_0016823 [Alligator mississippiensis]